MKTFFKKRDIFATLATEFPDRHHRYGHGILLHADSRLLVSILSRAGFRAPLVLCDPPWLPPATAATSSNKKTNKPITETRQSSAAMLQILAERVFEYAIGISDAAVIFSGELFLGGLLAAAAGTNSANVGVITWDKGFGRVNPPFSHRNEFAVYASRAARPDLAREMKGRRFLRPTQAHKPVHHESRIHHSEKPPQLYADILTPLTREGDIVIDLFAGSCPIIPAAAETGRRFIACEIDRGTYEAAIRHRTQPAAAPEKGEKTARASAKGAILGRTAIIKRGVSHVRSQRARARDSRQGSGCGHNRVRAVCSGRIFSALGFARLSHPAVTYPVCDREVATA